MSNCPLGPEMTAWSCGEEPFAIGAASMTFVLVLARAAGSGVRSSKRSSWQPDGASAEGCDESALHSMKNGSRAFARARSWAFGYDSGFREVGRKHLNVAGMGGPADKPRLFEFLKHACKFGRSVLLWIWCDDFEITANA